MATGPELSRASAADPDHVLDVVSQIVHLVTGRDAVEVRPDHALVADLEVDSLAMVEILEGAGQHFGVRIQDEAAKRFVLVRDLVDHLAAAAAPPAADM